MLIEKFIEWYLRRIKNETRQLQELQTQLENNKNVSLKVKGYVRERFSANYVRASILVACVAAIILIVAAVISSKCFDFYIDNKDVVLTFVGIIATFIVVTNYAQVIEIKKNFDQQVRQLKTEYDQNIDKVVEERNRLLTKHVDMLTKFCVAHSDENLLKLANKLIENFKKDSEYEYTVEYIDKRHHPTKQKTSINFAKGELQFRKLSAYKDITKIDNVEIEDINLVNILINRLLSIEKSIYARV